MLGVHLCFLNLCDFFTRLVWACSLCLVLQVNTHEPSVGDCCSWPKFPHKGAPATTTPKATEISSCTHAVQYYRQSDQSQVFRHDPKDARIVRLCGSFCLSLSLHFLFTTFILRTCFQGYMNTNYYVIFFVFIYLYFFKYVKKKLSANLSLESPGISSFTVLRINKIPCWIMCGLKRPSQEEIQLRGSKHATLFYRMTRKN